MKIPELTKGRAGATRSIMAKLLILPILGAVTMTGCIQVSAPEKPIEITLNVNVKQEVVVRFHAETGATMAAMQLGEPVADGDEFLRRFRVRRPDTFARWILGFAGAAHIERPRAMAARVRAMAASTLGVYDDDGAAVARRRA